MRGYTEFDWNDRAVSTLRQMWADGETVIVIAARLGMTKNAVVGKAHRLGLPARPSPIRRTPYVLAPLASLPAGARPPGSAKRTDPPIPDAPIIGVPARPQPLKVTLPPMPSLAVPPASPRAAIPPADGTPTSTLVGNPAGGTFSPSSPALSEARSPREDARPARRVENARPARPVEKAHKPRCTWLDGDAPRFRQCTAPAIQGQGEWAWCETHRRRVYRRPNAVDLAA